VLGDLFKSKQERELERRMALRRARKSFDKTIARLGRQRVQYQAMGQAAARNGSRDKVRAIAKAILQCNKMERQVERSRLVLELFETQRDIAQAKNAFSQALQGCRSALLGADLPREFVDLQIAREQANAGQEEIESLVEALLEHDRPALFDEPSEAEDLRLIEEAMSASSRPARREVEEAGEVAPAARSADQIDEDLKAVERELNLGQ